MEVDALRAQFKQEGLKRADLPADPYPLFARWLRQAEEAELPYPTGMSLATASHTGEVSSRIVLLRYFDQSGFVFFSGYDTKKGEQIAQNAQVALLFPWLILDRQVKILGTAVKITGTESLRFFTTRSKESQIGAWLSQSSEVISSRSILRMKLDEMKKKFADRQVPLPVLWGGYRVTAKSIEFWQGRSSGLHDRLVYAAMGEGNWRIERLAP
jgi:pyridoxamine 5'-phosphate oxidase